MFRDFQIVTLDFETYFDMEYSLRSPKVNLSGYIRDPQFKIQCVAIKVGTSAVRWYAGDDAITAIRAVLWSNSALLCHNSAFDGFILSHHFGIRPAYYLDTLSMARAVHGNSIRAKLDSVSKYYGVGNKLPDALDRSKGVRDLPTDVLKDLGQYCAVDVELCRLVFEKMRVGFPEAEFDQIDLTLRMFCDPILQIDEARARKALEVEVAEQTTKIEKVSAPVTALRSADKFIALLREADPQLEIPIKHSVKQKKDVPALAKGDLAFMALKEHPNPRVRDLVDARLASKSTIGETRAIRLLHAGQNGQKLPVLLNYCGAHTTRWSAGNKMNLQNLKRKSELRKSIIAPEGHIILSCDSSQIEARVLAWLADHYRMLADFSAWDAGIGEDIYKKMASVIFNKPIEEITDDERFVGKVAILGLGYGMGADKYEYTLAAGLMGKPIIMPNETCRMIVQAFRTINRPYPLLWAAMESILIRMLHKSATSFKCLEITKDNRILLPNGLYLHYNGLTALFDSINEQYRDFSYLSLEDYDKNHADRKRTVTRNKIYGGLLTENVVQALARVIVADQMLAISKELRVVTMTHDEVVCVVKESEAEQAKAFMLAEMRKAPIWCETLPLNAEAEYGRHYT